MHRFAGAGPLPLRSKIGLSPLGKIFDPCLLLLEPTHLYRIEGNPPPLNRTIQQMRQYRQLAVDRCAACELVRFGNGSGLGFGPTPNSTALRRLVRPLLLISFDA